MNAEYSLLMQHPGGAVNDLEDTFGFVLLEIPMIAGGEVKELAKNDWPDEDGDDVYIPSQLHFKAGTMKVKVGYTTEGGMSCQEALNILETYLSQGEQKLYSEWTKQGFEHCSLKGISDVDHFKVANTETITCDIDFYIHNTTERVTSEDFN